MKSMIEISKNRYISTNWTAKIMYDFLRSKGLKVNYSQESSSHYAFLDFVINGVVWKVRFNPHSPAEKAKVRTIHKFISHYPFPGEWIRIYRRHWWY